MESLPSDVLRHVLNFLGDDEITNACIINKNFSEKICNNMFWVNKIVNKYKLTREEIDTYASAISFGTYKPVGINYAAYYLYLTKTLEDLKRLYGLYWHHLAYDGLSSDKPDLVLIGMRNDNKNSDMVYYDAIRRQINMVRLLLDNKIPIPQNALREAVHRDSPEMVKLLLDNGVNPMGPANLLLEYTPIMWAITGNYSNKLEMVKLLLDAGINVHIDNDRLLEVATQKGDQKLIQLLHTY